MQLKTAVQIAIGVAGYIAWAVMAFLDPAQRPDFLHMNVAMVMGTVGLVLRDMAPSTRGTPTDKQSGNALPGLLAMLGLGAALTLAGCVTPAPATLTPPQASPQTMQTAFVDGCAAWNVAFSTAYQLRLAGQLNQSQVDQVTLLDSQITQICTGPLPADATTATQQVTAAVASMAILEAIHKEQ